MRNYHPDAVRIACDVIASAGAQLRPEHAAAFCGQVAALLMRHHGIGQIVLATRPHAAGPAFFSSVDPSSAEPISIPAPDPTETHPPQETEP